MDAPEEPLARGPDARPCEYAQRDLDPETRARRQSAGAKMTHLFDHWHSHCFIEFGRSARCFS
jgi:hypothetical protein